jgi:type II secretory pathway pseudopilin PulG
MNMQRKAYVGMEAVLALVLLGILGALLTGALLSWQRTRGDYVARRQAIWAAGAQLQRLMAGAPVDAPLPEHLLPDGVTCRVEVVPAGTPWDGMRHVTVTAEATGSRLRKVRESVSAYLPMEAPR